MLPDPDRGAVLTALGGDGGGYVELDPGDEEWWVPSGVGFFSADAAHTPAQEFAFAVSHFFLPRRRRDPFGHDSVVDYDAHDLLPVETRDAAGNTTTVGLRRPDGTHDPAVRGADYRVLQPAYLTDPNRNRVQVAFDALGQLVGRAVMGKAEEALGDALAGFAADLSEAVVLAQLADPLADPHAVLGRVTTRTLYDLHAYHRTRDDPDPRPAVTYTISRETYDSALAAGEKPKVQRSIEYSDGFARVIQRKVLAEPDPAVPATARWVGSGWTVFTNTGQPVRQYEPFFTATHAFEFAVTAGVSGVVFYDPLGRVVVRLHPHGAYEKAQFDAWHRTDFDQNDTVAGDPRTDPDVAGFAGRYLAAHPEWQTWRSRRSGGALGPAEQAAAAQTAAHADTPMTVHFDSLGRPFLTVTDAGPDPADPATHLLQHSRVELDVEGNQLIVRDALEQGGDPLGRIVGRFRYDMLGTVLRQTGMDAGERWALDDVTGAVIRSWTSRGHAMRNAYDVLRRPLRVFTRGLDAADPARELLTDRYVYGEQHPDAVTRNLRGEQFLRLDQAGAVTAEAFDFAGNPVTANRRLARVVDASLDWTAADAAIAAFDGAAIPTAALEAALAPMLESDAYVSTSTYDALDRAAALTTPHTPAMTPSVVAPVYNEAGTLERIAVRLRGAEVGGEPVWTPFVTGISYNAKGQRESIDYANGTRTTSTYDPLTFRLTSLHTVRTGAAFAGDRPQPPPAGWPGADVQNLQYTYDPVGNITRIRDEAQQTIFFRNRRVEPSAEFAYDALYRLTRATGREHLGQIGGAPVPHSPTDNPRVGIEWAANDGAAVGAYEEGYLYDAVGNLLRMKHRGSDPVHPGWTRTFDHASTSPIEDGTGGTVLKHSNRLSTSTVGAGPAEVFVYDAHGNTVRAPHLGGGAGIPNLEWDEHDRLRRSDLGLRGTVWFVSGADGERVRKVWRRSDTDTEERIYFSGFEIFRRRKGATALERETLHIMDDRARIALVETRTRDTAGAEAGPAELIRYQYSNHLGTAGLELDAAAEIISYEEYSPYGSTVYQALRAPNTALKRYRFAGKERDEETGYSYFGARYFAPWLARWISADPAGYVDGPNLYRFARDNPVVLTDPDGRQAAPQLDPEMVAKVGAVLTAAQRAAIAWRMAPGTAGLVPATAAPATAAAAPVAGPSTGAVAGTGVSLEAGLFAAAVVKEVALVSALYLTVQLHMMRSANIVMYGNPYGVPKTDSAFPVLRVQREMRNNPANDAYPETYPQPVPETEEEKKKQPQLRRIYVTYTKKNTATGMMYSGRSSMVIDLSKNIPLEQWANAAVAARDANHHIEDEAPEPKDPTYTQAKLDKFAVGRAVNYSNRYKDFAYLAIRGREQQLIDGYGAKRLAETGRTEELKNYAGGAKSDTKPAVTENSIRGVGKANKMGRYFHAAAIVYFNQEPHPYTGY